MTKERTIQEYHQLLTQKGRGGAMAEVGRRAGCRTKNDPTRVFLHGRKSKYRAALIAAAEQVIAEYEAAEKYRASRLAA